MSKPYDSYDKPTTHEFIVQPDKTLIHVRSGKTVACFFLTGERRDGKKFRMQFAGDSSGFLHMQGINLYNGNRWAKFTDGSRLRINITRN